MALVFRMLRNESSKAYYCIINDAVFISDIIQKLSEKDPQKIDNYPQETPYIQEIEVKP